MVIDLLLRKLEQDPTVKRHLLKTLSWRLLGSIDTFFLGWIITGTFRIGLQIGGLEVITKMVLYFVHERLWHKIRFGLPGRVTKADAVKKAHRQHLFRQRVAINRQQREALNNSPSFTIWLTGLSASGKSTIASALDEWLFNAGYRSYVIDGDNTRLGINSDLSFSKEDRSENIRRVAEICKLFNDAGVIVIASFISPFANDREQAKQVIGIDSMIEVFVHASVETCKSRDKKGLYKLAEEGKIKDFTGVNSPYEIPQSPDIRISTEHTTVDDCVKQIIAILVNRQPSLQEAFSLSVTE